MPLNRNRSDPELQALLFGAATTLRREAMEGSVPRLLDELDWPRLTEKLRVHKLLPVLGPRIVAASAGRAHEEFAADVDDAIAVGRRQGAFLQLISLRVMARLAAAGIRSAPLKGPMLSEMLYGDPGRRLSSDVDLLVHPDQLQDAVDVVMGLGYDRPSDFTAADGLPRLHFTLTHAEGTLPPIELHWRIHWYERRFAAERLLPPTLDADASWRPQPADQLAALLLFYARDGFIGLRLAADLSSWWDRFGSSLPERGLDPVIADYPELARAIVIAARAAGRVVGLPDERAICGSGVGRARERLGVRLANPDPRESQAQLYADRGFVDGLLTPPHGFADFVRRQLLPPREILDQQAGHGQRRRARSSLGRLLGILGRYGLTVGRLATPPGPAQ
jgi:Uncharacterised nucleotidyltransferase